MQDLEKRERECVCERKGGREGGREGGRDGERESESEGRRKKSSNALRRSATISELSCSSRTSKPTRKQPIQ